MELYFAFDENDELIPARNANKCEPYICPVCHERVTPVQGKVRVHHFRHGAGSKCNCLGMSQRHLAAQHILARRMLLPDLLDRGQMIELDLVELEKTFAHLGIRADLYGEFEEGQHEGIPTRRIMIEVKHTSPCSEMKIAAAVGAGYLLFEVDVSGFDLTDSAAFKRQLYDRSNWKQLQPKGQRTLNLRGGSVKPTKPLAMAKGIQFADCRIRQAPENRQMSLPFAQAAFSRLRESLLQLWLGLVFGLTFFIQLFRRP